MIIKKKDWMKIRKVREFFQGPTSELTGKEGILQLHHAWTPKYGLIGDRDIKNCQHGNGNGNGLVRLCTIWDGQQRIDPEEEVFHFLYYGGNNKRSLLLHEEQNRELFLKLKRYAAGSKRKFSPEIEAAIRSWIAFYPKWLREFRREKEKLVDRELVVIYPEYKLRQYQKKHPEENLSWWWNDYFLART